MGKVSKVIKSIHGSKYLQLRLDLEENEKKLESQSIKLAAKSRILNEVKGIIDQNIDQLSPSQLQRKDKGTAKTR